jgi:quinol-cytochrome oxidoreductase complex cytochrome b subunit
VFAHIIFLHYKGSSNPLSLTCELNKIEFLPRFLVKDLLNLVIFFLLVSFIYVRPFLVVEEENYNIARGLSSPAHIKPE